MNPQILDEIICIHIGLHIDLFSFTISYRTLQKDPTNILYIKNLYKVAKKSCVINHTL